MAGEMKCSSILDHVPIEEAVHKENTIKPGPWSNIHKRGLLIAPTVKAGFKGKKEEAESSQNFISLQWKSNGFLYLFQFTRTRMMTATWRKLNCFRIMYLSVTVAGVTTL